MSKGKCASGICFMSEGKHAGGVYLMSEDKALEITAVLPTLHDVSVIEGLRTGWPLPVLSG